MFLEAAESLANAQLKKRSFFWRTLRGAKGKGEGVRKKRDHLISLKKESKIFLLHLLPDLRYGKHRCNLRKKKTLK